MSDMAAESSPAVIQPPATAGRYQHIAETRLPRLRFFYLLRALVARELKARYRRSLLGPLWAVLQPLSYMVLFVLIRKMLKLSNANLSDVVYVYGALVPWMFFSNTVTRCGSSIYANSAVLKKLAVAREVFPAASLVSSFVDFVIASIILLAMMIWYDVPLSVHLAWVPLFVLLIALLSLGVGLAVAALGTYKRDVLMGITLLLQFWLLATPIMYPLSKVPERVRAVYCLNPMVGLIEGIRAAMLEGTAPNLALLGFSLLGIIVIWLVAWPLFRYLSQYFADVL